MIKRIGVMITLCAIALTIGITAQAKPKKKTIRVPLGEWWCTTYHASDNTPRGSHETSSGAYAIEGYTAAVDRRNPLVPMGSIIEVEGYGTFKVQDCGGFGSYNGGRRAFDLFMPENVGFCKPLNVTLIREETDEEYKKRLEKERKEKEKEKEKKRKQSHKVMFTVLFDPSLAPYQAITYDGVIKGGTIRFKSYYDQIRYTWYDVVDTKHGDLRVIFTGNRSQAQFERYVWLDEVVENAKG